MLGENRVSEGIRFLSLCGMLGYGYPVESLRAGMQAQPAFLGVDAGSTDPGPYYLGSGTSFVRPLQVKRDLELALCAARNARVPLIIGTAGGCGARPHVDSFLDTLGEIAHRRDLHFRLGVIHADMASQTVLDALQEGRITPCGSAGDLTRERVAGCTHIVAQMGTPPLIDALEGGADVVVAGRCCDAAIFAALPLRRGFDPALALHAAKIAECGTLCARPASAGDSLICDLHRHRFRVEPANPARRCSPESVAAHSLYEQPDPGCFYEPEGKVDLTACRYEQDGPRGVAVSGTWLVAPARPTVKLEGAVLQGYRAVSVAGVCDPGLIAHFSELEQAVRESVTRGLDGILGSKDFTLRFLRFGLDAVTAGRYPPTGALPREIGVVIDAVAPTQELADTVLSLARSTALHQHYPGRKTTAGNLAFPFSPSDFRGGAVFEFAVYHLLEPRSGEQLFPVSYQEL
jgi:hypothetical protein